MKCQISDVSCTNTATTDTIVTIATTVIIAPNTPLYSERKKHKKEAFYSNIGLKITNKLQVILTYCLMSQS